MNKLDYLLKKIDTEFKGKATDKAGMCEYLTEEGKKCLIGLFIPDGHEAQHDCGDVHSILNDYTDLLELMPSADLSKLKRLQEAHDYMNDYLNLDQQKEYLKQKAIEILGG